MADAISLLFLNVSPIIPFLISSLSAPSSFVMGIVSRTLNLPTDATYFAYFVGVGTIIQMFLLGLSWELLTGKIQGLLNRKYAADPTNG